jgi:phosphatidylglycerol lysyltransferase
VSDEETCRRVLALLQRYGREATSFQILEPGLKYWFAEDAVVGYGDLETAWVSAGEPVCDPARLPEVVRGFVEAAEGAGKRARFFHVSEEFALRSGCRSTHVGELPVWDPTDWDATVKSARSLREQIKRPRPKGVTARCVDAREMADADGPLRKQCDAVIGQWLHDRHMSELKFMVRLHPYGYPEERRYAIAEQNGRVIGFAVAIPVYGRKGWFIEDLVREPTTPNGTVELLIDTLMRAFASEGSHYATLGLAPLAGKVRPILALTRDYTTRLYNFPGVRSFKEKLRPKRWEPVYLAYPRGEFGVLALRDVLAAFASGGLLRFGLQTLVHQRKLATFLLAILLVPWTIALALMDTATWFPSARIQHAWTVFDALLIVLMGWLVVRWRAWLATVVVVLTTLDATLTSFQFLLWNVWTTRTLLAWCLVFAGCAGPLLAATFFWNTRLVAMHSRRLRV